MAEEKVICRTRPEKVLTIFFSFRTGMTSEILQDASADSTTVREPRETHTAQKFWMGGSELTISI